MRLRRVYIFFLVLLGLVSAVFYWRAHRYDEAAIVPPVPAGIAKAYFAGGCFWCTESDFEKVPGVLSVISGYAGGHLENPTYPEVVTETTGHREAVEVRYDPKKVSYQGLVEYFFTRIDPTDPGGQFVDRGESYTSALFFLSKEEEQTAKDIVAKLTQGGTYEKPIVTAILPLTHFWVAEEYHQDYYKKNPLRYEYYRSASGRDARISALCAYRATKGFPCVDNTKPAGN